MIVFVYANKDVNNNIEDTLNTMFIYVDKNIIDNVANKDIKDVRQVTFNNKDCFVKIVSMHTITNINNLKKDNKIKTNIEDVSMLIIVDRLYLEDKEVKRVLIIKKLLTKIISTIFFA